MTLNPVMHGIQIAYPYTVEQMQQIVATRDERRAMIVWAVASGLSMRYLRPPAGKTS